jgi:hypothetical protein
MPGHIDLVIRVSELDEFKDLLRDAFALDAAVAEFGIDDPVSIGTAYQHFHDTLHRCFTKPVE